MLGKYDVTQTFMRVMWQNAAGQGNMGMLPNMRQDFLINTSQDRYSR